MKNVVGDPVSGANFYGRDQDMRRLWHKLSRGSLVLAAPRRMGKTSMMYRMRDEPMDGWQAIHLSVESCATPEAFVAMVCGAVRKVVDDSWWSARRFSTGIADVLRRVEKVDVKVLALELESHLDHGRWRTEGMALVSDLAKQEGKTLIMIDEFPYFIDKMADHHGREQAESFLAWFRSLRQEMAQQQSQVRFVLYGSIGLDAVLSRLGVSGLVNDLDVVQLQPFSKEDARAVLEGLAKGEQVQVSAESIDAMLHCLGDAYVPFFVQLLFSLVHEQHDLGDVAITPELVRSAYDAIVTTPSNRTHFRHWRERLDDALDRASVVYAVDLLGRAAAQPNGVAVETTRTLLASEQHDRLSSSAARTVIDLLMHDGYLQRDGDRYRFHSPLLRDWWAYWYPQGESA